MHKEKLLIAFDEDRFFSTALQNKDNSVQEIYDILSPIGKEIIISDFFDTNYGEPFALYHLPKQSTNAFLCDLSPSSYIGYSYGATYNRNDGGPMYHPKGFFLPKKDELLKCNFYGKNIVVRPVSKKDIGRDSYYPNNYSYITEFDEITIFQDILKNNSYNLLIGVPGCAFDFRLPQDEVARILKTFETITHFRQEELYCPIKNIPFEEMIDDFVSIKTISQDFLTNNQHKISSSIVDQLQEMWKV